VAIYYIRVQTDTHKQKSRMKLTSMQSKNPVVLLQICDRLVTANKDLHRCA